MTDLFQKVLKELDDVGAKYFSVLVDSNDALQSELIIPASFTRKCGWPGETECGILTSVSTMREWPVKFEMKNGVWTSTGGGWQNFLRDKKVKDGQLVVLEQVDERCLSAEVYPRNPPLTFTKTLRRSHTRPGKSTRLDVPCKFWREVGEQNFNDVFYMLRGPRSNVVVKSTRSTLPIQTVCHLTFRWHEFVKKNSLKTGDCLLFSLVDQTVFEVSIIEKRSNAHDDRMRK